MYSKCNPLFKLTNRIKPRYINNSIKSSSTNATFKYSANMSNKDCVRLAFAYGLCGTLASYLSMNYDGKVLVFKFSVPTPERFVFCTWCWSLAGMATWRLSWTKPDALIRAAASRVKYGLLSGTQTTGIALGVSMFTISFWSIHFDFKEWQIRYREWQKSLTPKSTNLMTSHGASTSNALIEEEGNEGDEVKVNIVNMDDMDGVKLINGKLDRDENALQQKQRESEQSFGPQQVLSEPALSGQQVMNNMYEPCKIFFLCNAPIWLLTGNITGMIAARMLTNSVLLNPVNVTAAVMSMCLIDDAQQNDNLSLLD